MKTIVSLLVLPLMLFAQPQGLNQEEYFNVEFSMDVDMAQILETKPDLLESLEGTFELLIAVQIYVDELTYEKTNHSEIVNTPPKYLSTFSLVGLPTNIIENHKPQKQLNQLLALNDPMFPKENTLSNRLQPVRYNQNKLADVENILQGFGPLIRI